MKSFSLVYPIFFQKESQLLLKAMKECFVILQGLLVNKKHIPVQEIFIGAFVSMCKNCTKVGNEIYSKDSCIKASNTKAQILAVLSLQT